MRGNPEKYITVFAPNNPYSNTQGRIQEHRLKVYNALGGRIPSRCHIHHVDNNPKNNTNSNLVVCDSAYHHLIHSRTDALNACGDASKMKCAYCKEYDDPANMYVRPKQYQAWHLHCAAKQRRIESPKTGPYRYGTNPKYKD